MNELAVVQSVLLPSAELYIGGAYNDILSFDHRRSRLADIIDVSPTQYAAQGKGLASAEHIRQGCWSGVQIHVPAAPIYGGLWGGGFWDI